MYVTHTLKHKGASGTETASFGLRGFGDCMQDGDSLINFLSEEEVGYGAYPALVGWH